VSEVANPLVLQARADVDDPYEQCERKWDRDSGRCWHLNNRDDARDVAQEDEDKQAQQERGPLETRLAKRLHHDAFLDELNDDLSEIAGARRGNRRILAASQQEEDDANQRRGNSDQSDLVERWRDVLPAQDFVNRRELESEHVDSVSVVSGGEVDKECDGCHGRAMQQVVILRV